MSLFLGEEHRHHDDLEIGVPAAQFDEFVRALGDFDLYVAGGINNEGMVWPLQGAEHTLADHHQTWVREPATGCWRMDLFREPSHDGGWVCRRHPDITLAYDELISYSPEGIPFARPEVALLFKAKHQLSKDEADFAAVRPRLDERARERLAGWLELVHPGHSWITRLR